MTKKELREENAKLREELHRVISEKNNLIYRRNREELDRLLCKFTSDIGELGYNLDIENITIELNDLYNSEIQTIKITKITN